MPAYNFTLHGPISGAITGAISGAITGQSGILTGHLDKTCHNNSVMIPILFNNNWDISGLSACDASSAIHSFNAVKYLIESAMFFV